MTLSSFNFLSLQTIALQSGISRDCTYSLWAMNMENIDWSTISWRGLNRFWQIYISLMSLNIMNTALDILGILQKCRLIYVSKYIFIINWMVRKPQITLTWNYAIMTHRTVLTWTNKKNIEYLVLSLIGKQTDQNIALFNGDSMH